jgi:hypothetical protein
MSKCSSKTRYTNNWVYCTISLTPSTASFSLGSAYPEDDDDNDDNIYLQATWNNLAKEWEGHEHGVIAKVDCGDTEAAVEICQHFDIPVSYFLDIIILWEPSKEPILD